MSSSAQKSPSGPSRSKQKKGIGKIFSRFRTVLKSSGKRDSVPSTSAAAPERSHVTEETSPAGDTEQVPAEEVPAALHVVAVPVAASKESSRPAAGQAIKQGQGPVEVPRSQIHAERATKLAESFGIELKPSEWLSTEGNVQRIDRPIRMRVHRICHECESTFGAAKECPSCGHSRCKKCPRYPPKLTEAERIASRENRARIIRERKENAPITPDWDIERIGSSASFALTKPNKTGGRDLVYKKPRQRVRRTCCECKSLFTSGNKICRDCKHVRCTDCPREPHKKPYYPYGYPGDEFGKKSVPYFKCHECRNVFAAVGGPGNEAVCNSCHHTKCAECPRMKPRRIEPVPDPHFLESLRDKLQALEL